MNTGLNDNLLPEEVRSSRRVAVLSLRGFERHVYRAGIYEFEDVIAEELEDAELLTPGLAVHARALLRASGRIARRFPQIRHLGLGGSQARLEEDVDLFFFNPALCYDLVYLNTVRNWRKRSRFAICWLQEFWRNDINRFGHRLDVLNEFDHVFCPMHDSTEPLQARLSVPVSYLPFSVDTIQFCPWPNPPHRAIDVCKLGSAVGASTHDALIDYADRTGGYYQYGTTTGDLVVPSHRAHRRNYAGLLRRSRYFLTYRAHVAIKHTRREQEEFGLRYMEGIAAGAVLLGDRLANPSFVENFGWEDSVIPAPFDSADIVALIEALDADPARVEGIRRRNVLEALTRHDHLHRWLRVLEVAGLAPTSKLGKRISRLRELGALVGGGR